MSSLRPYQQRSHYADSIRHQIPPAKAVWIAPHKQVLAITNLMPNTHNESYGYGQPASTTYPEQERSEDKP